MTDLKPCPFCGGEAVRKSVIIPGKDEKWWYVKCSNMNCLVEPFTSSYQKPAPAARAWNSRSDNG